jgi:hypothetical protein
MCDIEPNFTDFNASLCYGFDNAVKDSSRNVMKWKIYVQ